MRKIINCEIKDQDVNKQYHCPEESSCINCSLKIPKKKSDLFKNDQDKSAKKSKPTAKSSISLDPEQLKKTIKELREMKNKLISFGE